MTPNEKRLFTWAKSASSKWADAWEERVCGFVGRERAAFSIKGPQGKLLSILACNLNKREARELKKAFGGEIKPQREIDWAARTARPRKPLNIRGRLIIADTPPPDAGVSRGRAWLQIPASAAFGTGDHATTAMCLRFLADLLPMRNPLPRLLDAGCGTAILAMASIRLGAASALAIDNDPLAIRIAKQNVKTNGLSKDIKLVSGTVSPETLRDLDFDIICANLFAGILENLFPLFLRHLRRGGLLIFSGVLKTQERQVLTAARLAGFGIEDIRRSGKWIAALARRP